MASTTYFDAEEVTLRQGSMRISEAYHLLHRSEAPAVPVASDPDIDGMQVSQSASLLGAKAALAAICLESYAALCVYIVWQYFRLFR